MSKSCWICALAVRRIQRTSAPRAFLSTQHSTGQFGSFQNDDVEELIRLSREDFDDYYTNLVSQETELLKKEEAEKELFGTTPPALGLDMRCHYGLDLKRWTFLNHGAFGAPSLPVLKSAAAWRICAESQPLRYCDRLLLPSLVRSVRDLAEFLGCDRTRLALLPNATTGLNAVIGSIVKPGSKAVVLEIGYGSVKKILARHGARVTVVELPIAMGEGEAALSEESLLAAVVPHLHGASLAIFDHITSNTALRLPVAKLAELCRAQGIPCLIDGAHALGMLPLDLEAWFTPQP